VVAFNDGTRVRVYSDGEAVPRAVESLLPPEFLERRQAQLDKIANAYGAEATVGQVDRIIERYRRICASHGITGRRFQRRLFSRAGWWAFLPRWRQGKDERRANYLMLKWFYGLALRDQSALVRMYANAEYGAMKMQRIARKAERMGTNKRLDYTR
jgi:hypothetical protein